MMDAMSKSPTTNEEFAALPVGPDQHAQPVAFWVEEDAPMSWVDESGAAWKLGRYANGQWFKQRI